MLRRLGPLLLALTSLTAGCGESSSNASTVEAGPARSSGSSADEEPRAVAIVSETAAGGTVDLHAVPLEEDADLRAFTAQFQRGEMGARIGAAIESATVPEDHTVVGAVVAIECDEPTSVTATEGPDGWVLEPRMPSRTMQECFAPVTSVALVAVPA